MPIFLFLISVEAQDQEHADDRIDLYLSDAPGIKVLDSQQVLPIRPYAGRHQFQQVVRMVLAEEVSGE